MTRNGSTIHLPSGITYSINDSDDPGRDPIRVIRPRIVPRAGGFRVIWPRGDMFWRPTLTAAVTQACAWYTMPRFTGLEE